MNKQNALFFNSIFIFIVFASISSFANSQSSSSRDSVLSTYRIPVYYYGENKVFLGFIEKKYANDYNPPDELDIFSSETFVIEEERVKFIKNNHSLKVEYIEKIEKDSYVRNAPQSDSLFTSSIELEPIKTWEELVTIMKAVGFNDKEYKHYPKEVHDLATIFRQRIILSNHLLREIETNEIFSHIFSLSLYDSGKQYYNHRVNALNSDLIKETIQSKDIDLIESLRFPIVSTFRRFLENENFISNSTTDIEYMNLMNRFLELATAIIRTHLVNSSVYKSDINQNEINTAKVSSIRVFELILNFTKGKKSLEYLKGLKMKMLENANFSPRQNLMILNQTILENGNSKQRVIHVNSCRSLLLI